MSNVLQLQRPSYCLTDRDGRPRLRAFTDNMSFLLAVDPLGNVRTLRYGLNGMNSKLTGEQIRRDKRIVGYRNIELTVDARAAGWRQLEAYYIDAVQAGELPSMRNFETVMVWYNEANKRRSGQMQPLVPPGYKVKRGEKGELADPDVINGVHRAYLPRAVNEMRRVATANRPTMPAPEKGRS